MFPPLNLNPAKLKIVRRGENLFVWDIWRKKEILLTPEEWVRQHLLHALVSDYGFPENRIAVEMQIGIGQLKRRCDAVIFDKDGNPKMIVECKEPDVQLNQDVVQQIAQYNSKLKTNWLLISNGLQHITLNIPESGQIKLYPDLLLYNILS